MCDKENCNCGSNPCCGDCEPWNCVEQAVNDVWSTKEGQIEGLVDRAETAAANSEASAKASADSAAEAKGFRDEAEQAATTAVAAEGIVVGVANDLQDTASKLEQIADELNTAISGIAVSTWYYTAVSDNQTVIPVPVDKNEVDIQSIYIEGARQEPNRGFVFDKINRTITLAEGLPLGLEIAIIMGTYSDNPNDFANTLASKNGTAVIGVKTSEATLEQLLAADDMALKYGQVTPKVSARLARKNCKIVLIGDSLSSFFNIDSVNTASIFESYLRRKIKEYNPSAQFYNLAIGGMRYYDLGRDEPPLAATTSGYPWYTDTSKRWMTYLDEIKPDVIFIAFGMNDGAGWSAGNFQQPNFFKMMRELNSMSSAPELVFCTNILPSNVNEATATTEQQEGRDAMAGWTRSFAKKAGYSFIDLHRRFKGLRDGQDPCMASFARKTIQKEVTLPYTHTTKCSSYAARVILIDPAVATTGITFKLSSYANNFLTLKYDTASSRWQTTIYTASASSVGIADQALAIGAVPVAGTEIYFTLNGDVVTITIGVNTYPVCSMNVARFGDTFAPVIGGTGSIRVDLMEGTPIPVKSELTDYAIYNTDGDGGNGLNHPTAKASSRIYSRPLDDWFGMLSATQVSNRHSVTLNFISGLFSVDNPYSPELFGETKIGTVLTFETGSLQYQRDADGRVLGAVFGATNRAFINQNVFNNFTGTFKKLDMEIEFITPAGQTYVCTLGENVTSDRLVAQVTADLRSRFTVAVGSQAVDLIGSASFPYIAGAKNTLCFSLDCSATVARMWEPVNSARGNIVNAAITAITAATLSKIKLGYLAPSSFGVDVVIASIKLSFSN